MDRGGNMTQKLASDIPHGGGQQYGLARYDPSGLRHGGLSPQDEGQNAADQQGGKTHTRYRQLGDHVVDTQGQQVEAEFDGAEDRKKLQKAVDQRVQDRRDHPDAGYLRQIAAGLL